MLHEIESPRVSGFRCGPYFGHLDYFLGSERLLKGEARRYLGPLKAAIVERDCNFPFVEERGPQFEFASVADREPDPFSELLVGDPETEIFDICPEQCPDP